MTTYIVTIHLALLFVIGLSEKSFHIACAMSHTWSKRVGFTYSLLIPLNLVQIEIYLRKEVRRLLKKKMASIAVYLKDYLSPVWLSFLQ